MPELNEVPEVAKLLATILTGDPVTHAHLGDAGAVAGLPLGPTRDPGKDPLDQSPLGERNPRH